MRRAELKASTFRWTQDMEQLRQAMTFGYGFYGEPYWKEEEAFLIEKFGPQKVSNTLCLGSGFFREFASLAQITSDSLVGVDIEEDILRASQDDIAKVNSHTLNVGLVTGNILNLPIRSGAFDLVVILFQGFGNVTDQKTALSEMIRVCSDFGTILVSVWKDDKDITDFRLKSYSSTGKKARIQHTSSRLAKIIMSENGVDVFSSFIFSDTWFYKTVEEFTNARISSITKKEYCSIVEIRISNF